MASVTMKTKVRGYPADFEHAMASSKTCEIVGPDGVESAEMDADAWQHAIDAQLKRLGLSGPGLGRSSMVCNMADNGIEVTLSDNATDWCKDADAEDVLAILEAIDAEQDGDEIRAELASDLNSM